MLVMWVKTLYTSTFILYSKKEQLNALTFRTLYQYCAPPTIRSFQSTYWSLRTHSIIAGLSRAQTARGTEPHTHKIWSTSFRLVVTWLTERTYGRTYASTDCTGRVGETIKRKGGVSQVCLGKPISFILAIHNMVNWQLSKQDSH